MRNKRIFKTLLLGAMLSALSCPAAAYAEAGPGVGMTVTAQQSQDAQQSQNAQTSTEAAAASMSAETKARLASLLKNTETAKKTDQIILVVDHQLSLWNKNKDGSFTNAFSCYAGYGRNGLRLAAERQEGDSTTPIGSFPILLAFGQGENPGTSMTWRKITPQSYWSGEEATYNTWVESAVPIGGEHLQDYAICYEYAMAVGFNTNPTVYKRGSAIFLHVKNPETWSSSGCVSVERDMMLSLLSACHDGAYIMIVPSEADIAQY